MVTHPEVMEEADRWDRVAVMIWWHHIADMEKQPPPPGSLEKMVQTIREAIGVAEGEWKSLKDLVKPQERYGAPDYHDKYYQGPQDFPMPIYRDVRELVCAVRALNETEQMQGCLELARNLLHCGNQHLDFQEALWEQGNAWEAWIWTLGMIAEHYEHGCRRGKKHELPEDPVESFGKSLRQHIKENLPWPECSWTELLIRAREWVAEDLNIGNELEEALGGAAQVNQAYIHWGPEEMMEEVDQEVRRQMKLPESARAPETRHELPGRLTTPTQRDTHLRGHTPEAPSNSRTTSGSPAEHGREKEGIPPGGDEEAEMKRVKLVQLDGKLPNLALMKLAHWHRAQGDEVRLSTSVQPTLFDQEGTDIVYGSAIFTKSFPKVAELRAVHPRGGPRRHRQRQTPLAHRRANPGNG